jgi:hypothetical protein
MATGLTSRDHQEGGLCGPNRQENEYMSRLVVTEVVFTKDFKNLQIRSLARY